MDDKVFIRLPCLQKETITIPYNKHLTVSQIIKDIALPKDNVYVSTQGQIIHLHEHVSLGQTYDINIRVCGGKGGFGSMLRAIGAQIEKTTNREACRDLSGRRMRDVNNEKKLVEYLEKKSQLEEEKAKKKKEKLEKLTQKPRHIFNDPEYEKSLHEAVENVDDAVQKGMKKEKVKRKINEKHNKEEPEPKRSAKLWLGEEFNDLSDSDSDSENLKSITNTTDIKQINTKNIETEMPSTSSDASSSSHTYVSSYRDSTSLSESKNITIKSDATECNLTNDNDIELPVISENEHSNDSKIKTVDMNRHDTQKQSNSDNDIDRETSQDHTSIQKSKDGSGAKETALEKSIDDKNCTAATSTSNEKENKININYKELKTLQEVEALGMDVLKAILVSRGVKCGGTLQQRAERVFKIKNLNDSEIEPNMLAKKKNK